MPKLLCFLQVQEGWAFEDKGTSHAEENFSHGSSSNSSGNQDGVSGRTVRLVQADRTEPTSCSGYFGKRVDVADGEGEYASPTR